jgi:hypothetical protein
MKCDDISVLFYKKTTLPPSERKRYVNLPFVAEDKK